MGKKQHQKDKLYITHTEWREEWCGKKRDAERDARAKFRRLPFSNCALSMQPFENPYCTKEGVVFDLLNIMPFLKKHGVNPVTGDPLTFKELIKLNFHKNSDDKYHCPVLFKVFNENSHIVAVRTTGNVYSYEAIEQLNINPKHWKDLITDEPFTRSDIIHIQDPTNLDKRNIADYFYVKMGLSVGDSDTKKKEAQVRLLNLNAEATETLKTLEKDYKPPTEGDNVDVAELYNKPGPSVPVPSATFGNYNAALYSTGRAAASFTSTVCERVTKVEAAVLDDDSIRYKYMPKGKKGYVRLVTTLGNLNIELHCDLVPKTCDNFIRHCKSGYYKGCEIFRVVRNFMCQTGDPNNNNDRSVGGKSAFGDGAPFEDEFMPQLLHNARGVVSMAHDGRKNQNRSQFMITFAPSTFFDRKHSVFGRIVGGMDTLLKIERVEVTDEGEKPLKPITILDTVVFVDPFLEADENVKKAKEAEQKAALAAKMANKPVAKVVEKQKALTMAAATGGVGKYIAASHVQSNIKFEGDSKKPRLG